MSYVDKNILLGTAKLIFTLKSVHEKGIVTDQLSAVICIYVPMYVCERMCSCVWPMLRLSCRHVLKKAPASDLLYQQYSS